MFQRFSEYTPDNRRGELQTPVLVLERVSLISVEREKYPSGELKRYGYELDSDVPSGGNWPEFRFGEDDFIIDTWLVRAERNTADPAPAVQRWMKVEENTYNADEFHSVEMLEFTIASIHMKGTHPTRLPPTTKRP